MSILDRLDTDPDRHEKSEQHREAAHARHNSRTRNASRRTREKTIDVFRMVWSVLWVITIGPFRLVFGVGVRALTRLRGEDDYDADTTFGILRRRDSGDGRRWSR